MPTTFPSALPANWNQGGSLPAALYGIRVTLLLSFVLICLYSFFFEHSAAIQHDQETLGRGVPVWVGYLFIGFLFLLHAVSFALLSLRSKRFAIAGAGVATGFCATALLFSPFMLMRMYLLIGLSSVEHSPDRGLVRAGLCLLLSLGCDLWIVISGFLIGKSEWRVFLTAGTASVVYLAITLPQMQLLSIREQQKGERRKEQRDMTTYMPAMLARQRIVSLTDCLLQERMVHPEADFPASFATFPQGLGCANAPPAEKIPEYTFSYTPKADASSGKNLDFQLVGMPRAKGFRGREPIMTDRRGIVFVNYPWEMIEQTPKIMIMPSERFYSQIDVLRENIEHYIREKNNGQAPSTLTQDMFMPVGHEIPSIEDSGTLLRTRDYAVRYVEGKGRKAGGFTLSAQCKSYGQNCLRSYFADFDGAIHATGEPREANGHDPLSPQCERVSSECQDVSWSVPDF